MLVLRTAVAMIAIDASLWLLANGMPLVAFLVAAAALPFVAGRSGSHPRSRDVWLGQLTDLTPRSQGLHPGSGRNSTSD